MASGLPPALRIGERRPAIAVDAAFALSPYGLLAVMTLAGIAHVYVPRSLLGPLDNSEAICRNPAGLASRAWDLSAEELAGMAEALGLWRRAWHFGRLASRVHWIGDLTYESMQADREDAGLRARFEWCAAAFENSFAEAFNLAYPLDACARDALALAAAVLPDPVLLLTAGGTGDAPPLCRLLGQAGLPVAHDDVDACVSPAPWFAPVVPVLRTANAALVQALVPGAMALPEGWSADQDWEGESEALLAWDIWSGARLIWRHCSHSSDTATLRHAQERAA